MGDFRKQNTKFISHDDLFLNKIILIIIVIIGVTILGNVTKWVIEGFRIEGIDSIIRISIFV